MIQEVKVGPIIYTVKEVDAIREGANEYDGMIYYNEARIEVDQGLDHQFERVVLMHEIMHAVLKQAGQASGDEKLITALGYGLVDLIQQNPELIRYIMQGEAQ